MHKSLDKENDNTRKTIISMDAMGSDHGTLPIVEGIAKALKENNNLRFLIHGDKIKLYADMKSYPEIAYACELIACDTVVEMNEKPSSALRSGKKSSMWGALASVANGTANIALSCGNTGALMAMAMIQLRKAPGINRPAIAVLWPSLNDRGFNIVLDAGADIKAESSDLIIVL